MKYKAYTGYKESYAAWLGNVPSEWDVMQLRRITHLQQGLQIPQEKRFHEAGRERVEYITIKYLNAVDSSQAEYILSATDRVLCTEDDILLARTGATGQVVTGVNGAFHNNFFKVNYDKRKVMKDFLVYFLRVKEVIGHLLMLAGTTTIPDLNHGAFLGTKIALPILSEQWKITNFLDHETAKIDTLIEKQQQLIKLLKEKRQAVISHAVTKGLNPNAPMRDSGVEWLGEVPEHWVIASISSLSNKITNGYVGPTRDIFYNAGVSYLQSLHIKNNKIDFHTPYYVSKKWSDSKQKSILVEGDVLVVQTGDIGQVAAVTKEFESCNCHALIIITTTDEINGFYLSWLLNSDYGFHNLKSIQTGALHPHLNCNYVKTVKVTVPSIDEQTKIVKFAEETDIKYDHLMHKANDQIELLKERRTALISAAVTGKIDVRNWQAPNKENKGLKV